MARKTSNASLGRRAARARRRSSRSAEAHRQPTPDASGDDVRRVSDDIAADGSPLVDSAPRGFVAGTPDYDGESDRLYSEVQGARPTPPAAAPDEAPLVNRHSPEGARLDEIKTLRPVVYAARDAQAGDDAADDDPASSKGGA